MHEELDQHAKIEEPSRAGVIFRILFIVLCGALLGTTFGFGTSPLLDFINSKIHPDDTGHVAKYLPISIGASSLLGFLLGAGLGNVISTWFTHLVERWDRMD